MLGSSTGKLRKRWIVYTEGKIFGLPKVHYLSWVTDAAMHAQSQLLILAISITMVVRCSYFEILHAIATSKQLIELFFYCLRQSCTALSRNSVFEQGVPTCLLEGLMHSVTIFLVTSRVEGVDASAWAAEVVFLWELH